MPAISGITNVRRVANSLLSPGLTIVSFCFVVLFWFRSLTIEPFDSLESVHRMTSSEIKRAGQLGAEMSALSSIEQPISTVYSSLLATISTLLDGEGADVSAFSGRFFSILLSLLVLWSLHSTWKNFANETHQRSFENRRIFTTSLSPVFYMLLSAPALAASVLFSSDLLFIAFASIYVCKQTMFIISVLNSQKLQWKHQFVIASVLAGALATEGWSGFFVLILSPLFFAFLAWLYFRVSSGAQKNVFKLQRYLGQLSGQVVGGVLLFLIAFASLKKRFPWGYFGSDNSSHAHVETVSTPSSEFVGFIVIGLLVFCCFSYLVALLIYSYCIDSNERNLGQFNTSDSSLIGMRASVDKLQTLWFLSLVFVWGLCFLLLDSSITAVLFGFPVLALWAVLFRGRQSFSVLSRYRKTVVRVSHFLTFFLPAVLLALSTFILIHSHFQLNWAKLIENEGTLSIISAFSERSLPLGVSLFIAGILSFFASLVVFQWASVCLERKRRSELFLSSVIRLVVLFQTVVAVVLLQGVVAEAEDVLTISLEQAVNKAKLYLEPNEQLATAGLLAPNIISYFGGPVNMRKDAAEDLFQSRKYSVVLTPDWNIGLCEKHGYDIAAGAEFYRICLRSYKRTLEGPHN